MLVLVAVKNIPGHRPGDRNFAVEGELVTPIVLDCLDSRCDVCRSAWIGLASSCGTTTALVADRPGVTIADLRRNLHEWLDNQGVIDGVVQACEADGDDDPVAAVAEMVDLHVAAIVEVCASYPVGTLVTRLGDLVAPRVDELAA